MAAASYEEQPSGKKKTINKFSSQIGMFDNACEMSSLLLFDPKARLPTPSAGGIGCEGDLLPPLLAD